MKNAFYAQSGGVTAVINASACGVIETARKHRGKIGKVYAGRHGIIGALTEDMIDTGKESAAAIRALSGLVAAGGTLLVIARATDDQDPVRDPALMPWPLTRSELESIAGTTLTTRTVEHFLDAEDPPKLRWRAEFRDTGFDLSVIQQP